MATLTTLLDSDTKVVAGLLMMSVLTCGLLAFVLHVHPFGDGDGGAEALTDADKMQAILLVATLVTLLFGATVLQLPCTV
jgi:hypothetical protein